MCRLSGKERLLNLSIKNSLAENISPVALGLKELKPFQSSSLAVHPVIQN